MAITQVILCKTRYVNTKKGYKTKRKRKLPTACLRYIRTPTMPLSCTKCSLVLVSLHFRCVWALSLFVALPNTVVLPLVLSFSKSSVPNSETRLFAWAIRFCGVLRRKVP